MDTTVIFHFSSVILLVLGHSLCCGCAYNTIKFFRSLNWLSLFKTLKQITNKISISAYVLNDCFFEIENKLTKKFHVTATTCFIAHIINFNDSYCFLIFNFFKIILSPHTLFWRNNYLHVRNDHDNWHRQPSKNDKLQGSYATWDLRSTYTSTCYQKTEEKANQPLSKTHRPAAILGNLWCNHSMFTKNIERMKHKQHDVI